MAFSAIDWQKKIYLNGFAGKRPVVPTDFESLEHSARVRLSQQAYAYVSGGAGEQSTLRSNRVGFENIKIVPKMLRDVEIRNTTINLFGRSVPSPILFAPIGVLELVHPDGDLAVAKAAVNLDVPFIFSNQASVAMEHCAKVMGDKPRWFQLYWSKSRALISNFIHRAEACGCETIVVTLDTTMLGWRPMDLNLGYLPFLEGKGIAQYTSDSVFQTMLDEPDATQYAKPPLTVETIRGAIGMARRYPGNNLVAKITSGRPLRAVRKFIDIYSNPATTWDDLQFLRGLTKLNIILKGILHPDDAVKAIQFGMDGIIVSNHGGRQVDGAIATIQALPAVIEAVRNQIPVLLDSGVRTGADVFKALALGAKAVCVGRPYVYGLAIAGQQGVEDVIHHMMTQFELTMALAGCSQISEINSTFVRTT
ncbi:MAG: lactate 2-monooxygenase [Chryseolinea sp.]